MKPQKERLEREINEIGEETGAIVGKPSNDFSSDYRKKLIMFMGVPIAIMFGAAIGNSIYDYSKLPEPKSRYEVYTTFGKFADTNRDGDLTEQELIETYHELGLKYDARHPMPSENQMRSYIEK